MKVLNLYAGVGGNRKLWKGVQVTAVEYTPKIAEVYKRLHPNDTVIIADAHEYLLQHFKEFDFIWSSPPCQSHTRMIRSGRNRKPRYPDLKLYEEIMLLRNDYKGKWVVENVIPYYKPLIEPTKKIGRHLLWSNFEIPEVESPAQPKNFILQSNLQGKKVMHEWLGIHYEENIYYEGNHCPTQVLRNCVHPLIGEAILKAADLWDRL